MLVEGVAGRPERARLLRVLLLRAEHRQAEPGQRRRRQGLRRSEHRDDPVRRVRAAVATAVHVSERRAAQSKPGVARSCSSSSRQLPQDRRPGADRAHGLLAGMRRPSPTWTRRERLAAQGSVRVATRMEAGTERWERGAGEPTGPRRRASSLGRAGDQGCPLPRRADLGADHARDRRLAARRDDQVLPGRRQSGRSSPTGTGSRSSPIRSSGSGR